MNNGQVLQTREQFIGYLVHSERWNLQLTLYDLFLSCRVMVEYLIFIFQYISNKMQRYTVYFIWKLLYMFRVVLPPIIRSANNCIYSVWYLHHTVTAICRYRGRGGTGFSVLWVAYVAHSTLKPVPTLPR